MRVIQMQPAEYWKRLPGGQHIREVLAVGAEFAELASDACSDADSRISVKRVDEIRTSLVKVTAAEKSKVLGYLDEAWRKCANH